MARRLIDISVPLQNDVARRSARARPEIEYIDHEQSAAADPAVLPRP